MKMLIQGVLTTLVLLLLSGCGTSDLAVPTQQNWLENPPADNANFFYGVGVGGTQKEAKSDALSSISAKISVSVASNFSTSVSAKRQEGDERVLRETKDEVVSKSKEIEYTDVKVLKSDFNGKEWIVLLEVSRDLLLQHYTRKLDAIDQKIQTEWEWYQKGSFFEKVKRSVTLSKLLKQTDTLFPLLYALKSDYDDSSYRSRYENYTKEMRKAQEEMIFAIRADKNSQSLASLIRSKLSAQNIALSDTNYNILIEITTHAKMRKYPSTNKEFANLTFALRDTLIKVSDRATKSVSNTLYKTKESSSIGFEDAIARGSKYEQKIQQMGIFPFLTGN